MKWREQRAGAWRWRPPRAAALTLLTAVCAGCAALALHWSTGGHLSTDSTQQLHEALLGRSVSWNPPFMSALLAALGGDQPGAAVPAAGRFVVLMALLLWGGLAVAVAAALRPRVPLAALLAVALLLANPVLLVHAGIVWKDVFAAALLTFSAALGITALGARHSALRVGSALFAMGLLTLLPLVRQQGVFLAPWFALLPILALAWMPRWRQAARVAAIIGAVALALLAHHAAERWSAQRIAGNDGRAVSVGFSSIYRFDLAGMEAYTRDGPLIEAGAPREALAELAERYSAERIDFMNRAPALSAFLRGFSDGDLRQLWLDGVLQHPNAYLTHRRVVFERLLGIGGVMGCLPVHLGVSGLPDTLAALDLKEEIDARDRELYAALKPLFGTPLFGHWFYLSAMFAMALFIGFRRTGRTRLALAVIVFGTIMFYGSFIPTGIACDFRYLFPAIPIVTLLALLLLLGWREASEQDEAALNRSSLRAE